MSSPQKRPRSLPARNPELSAVPPKYKRGAICRIRLHDFLTYADTELHPGPALNLVIGPNGTGKSSIVCAICLGLAGKTSSLGRVDKVRDYVRNGCSEGFVELELYNARETRSNELKNVVIRRTITIAGKSTWAMNNRTVTENDVANFAKKLNIQVNNLLSFMAQEKVSSFVKMNNYALLKETEKVVEPRLLDHHEKLIVMRTDQRGVGKQLEENRKVLLRKQEQMKELEGRAARFQQIDQLKQQVKVMRKKRYWVKQGMLKREARKTKDLQLLAEEEAKKVNDEKEPMEEELKQLEPQHEEVQNLIDNSKKKRQKVKATRKKLESGLDQKGEQITVAVEKIEHAEKEERARQKKIEKYKTNIKKLKEKKDNAADTDFLEQERKKVDNDYRKERASFNTKQEKILELTNMIKRGEYEVKALTQRVQRMGDARTKRINLGNRIFTPRDNSVKLLDAWVDKNRHKFRQPVFGPMFAEIQVQDPVVAAYVDAQVSVAHKLGYVTQCKEDKMLLVAQQKRLRSRGTVISRQDDRVNIPNQNFPGSVRRMHEFIECPPLVLAGLCDVANVQLVGVSTSDLQAEKVLPQRRGGHGPQILYVPAYRHSVRFSAYSGDRSVSCDPIRKTSNLFAADTSEEEVDELKENIQRQTAEVQRLKEEKKQKEQEMGGLKKRVIKLKDTRQHLVTEIRQIKQLDGHIQAAQKALRDLCKKPGVEKKVEGLKAEIRTINLARVKFCCKLVEVVQSEHKILLDLEVLELKGCHIHERIRLLRRQLDSFQQRVREAHEKVLAAKRTRKNAVKRYHDAKKKAEKEAPLSVWQTRITESKSPDTLDELTAEITKLQVRADSIHTNQGDIDMYRKLEKEVAALVLHVQNFEKNDKEKRNRIQEMQESFEEELKGLVAKVNGHFRVNFQKFGVQGEIKLSTPEDFEKWGLEIHVSYREESSLSQLMGGVQSGGERTVATMCFLLSLQHITDCPFRVVDEINQGMDSNFERKMFQFIVDSSISQEAAEKNCFPQYFLVTPKLLPNLTYSDTIQVLLIYSGSLMVPQPLWADCIDGIMPNRNRITGGTKRTLTLADISSSNISQSAPVAKKRRKRRRTNDSKAVEID